MFENVASKIQKAAKIIWVVGVIIHAVGAFALMMMLVSVWAEFVNDAAEIILLVLGAMALCVVIFFIATLWLYFVTLCIKGFGRLIENTDRLADGHTDEAERFISFNE